MPELNQEEQELFQKWLGNKQARKVKSTSRRKAMTELKNAHKAEYNKLVKQFGGTTG